MISKQTMPTLPPQNSNTVQLSVLEAHLPSKFQLVNKRSFPYLLTFVSCLIPHVHLARNAGGDGQYTENYTVKCSNGFCQFICVSGICNSQVLDHCTMTLQITSFYYLCSMWSFSYSFTKYNMSILCLIHYHVLNYYTPPPLIEMCTEWYIGETTMCVCSQSSSVIAQRWL